MTENRMVREEFSWIPFYEEFADRLLDYRNNRQEYWRHIFAQIKVQRQLLATELLFQRTYPMK